MLRNIGPRDVPLRSYPRRQFENRGAAATPDVEDALSRTRRGDLERGLRYTGEEAIDRFVVRPGAGRRAIPEFHLCGVARIGMHVGHRCPSISEAQRRV